MYKDTYNVRVVPPHKMIQGDEGDKQKNSVVRSLHSTTTVDWCTTFLVKRGTIPCNSVADHSVGIETGGNGRNFLNGDKKREETVCLYVCIVKSFRDHLIRSYTFT